MQLTLQDNQIWIGNQAVDFRRSIDGLCSVIAEQFNRNPQAGLYIFYNRTRDKIKALGWHRNGFVLIYKRLERGRFHVINHENDFISLDKLQLSWLLAGLDWPTMTSWDELEYEEFY